MKLFKWFWIILLILVGFICISMMIMFFFSDDTDQQAQTDDMNKRTLNTRHVMVRPGQPVNTPPGFVRRKPAGHLAPDPGVRQPGAANTARSAAKNQADNVFGKSRRRTIEGIAFLEAAIAPMEKELDRFWGWRPNDIIQLTDNVKNYQLGVLKVTQQTAVALAEYLSRTGRTDAYVSHLENAQNWFMIKPTELFFPSAENKYSEGLEELEKYKLLLVNRKARFYVRMDNLVPLIKIYESILGSCDQNLARQDVGWFESDDYFYYTKGVVGAMLPVMEAVSGEFDEAIAQAQAKELLERAIFYLQAANEIDPLIILEGSPGGLLANHRANLAAPVSHARFYLGVLVTALTGNIN